MDLFFGDYLLNDDLTMANGLAGVEPSSEKNTGNTHTDMKYVAKCAFGACNMQQSIVGNELILKVLLSQSGNNRLRSENDNKISVCYKTC